MIVLSYLTGYQTVAGFHFLGRYLRFLFIIPVFLAFRRYPPTAKTAFIGLALGALTAGVMASLEFMYAHGPIRVDAQTDLSIIFGDLTTTMVLCMVAGFGLMAASRRRWSVPLLSLCLVGGVVASLLSGTRGAWLPLFLLIPALITPAAGFLKRRYIFIITLVLATIFSSFYFMARTGTQERLLDIGNNLRNYFVAIDTLGISQKQSQMRFHCLNTKAFLEAWSDAAHLEGNDTPSISLAADPSMNVTTTAGVACSSGYVLHIQNTDINKTVHVAFPRAPLEPGSSQYTDILARGMGSIAFAGAEGTAVAINSPKKYQTISVKSNKAQGSTIDISVGPNNSLWLLPIENYIGEYSFSIANNSIGQRFELWRSAWRLFVKHPLLGVGTGAYQVKTDELIDKGVIAPYIGSYDHPHNDYMDALASRGIMGLMMLIAILWFPIGRFLQATRNPEPATHAIGLAGVLTVAGFAIYALTDTVFLHSMMITWYVIYMALFYALLDTQAGQKSNPQPVE
ncbi:MAG: O-antigen ligase family protein [Gammaproteobacteria bacterium]